MGRDVEEEQTRQDGEQKRSEGVPQGRDQDEEHRRCEDEESQPAGDLLWVKW